MVLPRVLIGSLHKECLGLVRCCYLCFGLTITNLLCLRISPGHFSGSVACFVSWSVRLFNEHFNVIFSGSVFGRSSLGQRPHGGV